MDKEAKPTEQKPAEAPAPITETKAKDKEMVTESNHSNNKVLVIVLVVIGVFIVLGIAGSFIAGKVIKKAATTVVENATDTKITTDSKGNTTVTTNDGSVPASTEQKLPSDFPTGIPLYENIKIVSSYKQKVSTGSSWQVTAESDDGITKVVESVKSAYSKSPWTTDTEVEYDGSYTLKYNKPGYEVLAFVTESADMSKTSISYTVSEVTAEEQ